MQTIRISFGRKTRIYLYLILMTIVLSVTAIVINHFVLKLDLLLFLSLAFAVLGNGLWIGLLIRANQKSVKALEKTLSKTEQQIDGLANFSSKVVEEPMTIAELDQLRQKVNGLVELYNHFNFTIKNKEVPENVKLKIDNNEILARGDFNQAVYYLAESNDAYRSAYLLVRLLGKDQKNPPLARLHQQIRHAFNQPIVGQYDENTLAIYLSSVSSLALFESSIQYLYRHFVEASVDKNKEGIDIFELRIGASVYPYSGARELEGDALFALSKTNSYNLYIPRVRQYDLKRIETQESRGRQLLLNAEVIFRDLSGFTTHDEVASYLKKNLLRFARQFGFNNAGYLTVDEKGEQFICQFEDVLTNRQLTFKRVEPLTRSYLKPIFDYVDLDGGLYGTSELDYPIGLSNIVDNLGIQSFYFQELKSEGQTIGLLYFTSDKPRREITLSEKGILVLYSSIFGEMIKAVNMNLEKKRVDDLISHLLKMEEKYVYVVSKTDYRLKYVSANLRRIYPNAKVGDLCHTAFNYGTTPCPFCPFKKGVTEATFPLLSNVPMVVSSYNYSPDNEHEVAIVIEKKKADIALRSPTYIDANIFVRNQKRLFLDFAVEIREHKTGYLLALSIKLAETNTDVTIDKQYNDALEAISKRLMTVGYDEMLYRLNDSTLVLFFKGLTRPAALEMLEDVFAHVQALDEHHEIKPTYDLVLAQYPSEIGESSQIEKSISAGLNDASKAGRNMVYVMSNRKARPANRKDYIIDFIDEAVRKKTLESHIQPMINPRTGQCVGGELLLRLYDPSRGFIPPAEFVPLASKKGRMYGIEETVLYTIGELWKTYGFTIFHAVGIQKISMNLSMDSITNDGFADTVKKVVARYKLPKNFIQFEISERMLEKVEVSLRKVMEKLANTSVVFALDNFTNQRLSYDYVQTFKFNVIKIDREIVQNIDKNSADLMSFIYVYDMLKKAGVDIVVEGVENNGQAKTIKELDIPLAQGYYFAKPMPINDFIKYLNFGK